MEKEIVEHTHKEYRNRYAKSCVSTGQKPMIIAVTVLLPNNYRKFSTTCRAIEKKCIFAASKKAG